MTTRQMQGAAMNTGTLQILKSQKGFAILETLIAFIVLAVGLLVLFSFNASSLQNISDARLRLLATQLAQDKMQDMRTYMNILSDWDDRISVCDVTIGGVLVNGATENIASPFASFRRTCAVTIDAATPNIAEVSVSVDWTNDRSGAQVDPVVLNSMVFLVDPTTASSVLEKAIAEDYVQSGETPEKTSELECVGDDCEDRNAEEGPWTHPDLLDGDGNQVSFLYRIKISGDVKKLQEDITLPEAQITTDPDGNDFGAVCDFGSSATYKRVRGKTTTVTWVNPNDYPTFTEVLFDSNDPDVADNGVSIANFNSYFQFSNDGGVDLNVAVPLGIYTVTYNVNGSASKTATIEVILADGSFLCYAYFNNITPDANGENYGWTGTFNFDVEGGVFCFPVTGVIAPSSAWNPDLEQVVEGATYRTSSQGETSFAKFYEDIITDQTLFLMTAGQVGTCDSQLGTGN